MAWNDYFQKLFPREFDRAHDRKGVLHRIFAEHKPYAKAREKFKAEKAELRDKIEKFQAERLNSLDELVNEYYSRGLVPCFPKGTYAVELGRTRSELVDLTKYEILAEFAEKNFFAIRGTLDYLGRFANEEKIPIKWAQIEDMMPAQRRGFRSRANVIREKSDGAIQRCQGQIGAIEEKEQQLNAMPIQDVIREGKIGYQEILACFLTDYPDAASDRNECADAIKLFYKLIEIGAIDERYSDYITQHTMRSLALGDIQFVRTALVGGDLSGFGDLSSPVAVIDKIDARTFERYDVFNKSIALSLMRLHGSARNDFVVEEKLNYLASRMAQLTTPHSVQFVVEVLKGLSAEEVDEWFALLNEQNTYFQQKIELLFETDGWAVKLAMLYAGYLARRKVRMEGFWAQLFANGEDVNALCREAKISVSAFLDVVEESGIRLRSDSFIKLNDGNILERVISRGLFEVTQSVVVGLLKFWGCPREKINQQPYGAICQYGSKLLPWVDAEFGKFFENVYAPLLGNRKGRDPVDVVAHVMLNAKASIDAKALYLRMHEPIKLNICEYSSDVTLMLLRGKFVFPNVSNLVKAYEICGYQSEIGAYVVDVGTQIFKRENDWSEKTSEIVCKCIKDESIDDNALRGFLAHLNHVHDESLVFEITNVGPKRLETLCKARVVRFNSDYYLRLKKEGKGAHLTLAKHNLKTFLTLYRDEWLNKDDALALLEADQNGQRPERGIIALRKAIHLIKTVPRVQEKLASYVCLDDLRRTKRIFSNEQLKSVIDCLPDPNCRANVLMLFNDKASVLAQLRQFPEANFDSSGRLIQIRLHTKEAKDLVNHLKGLGMSCVMGDEARNPTIRILT